jgi:serine/threonine protein phosphatase 1
VTSTRSARNFAHLRGTKRVWAVASVRGTAGRLARLHNQIEDRFRAGDRVVYLGNYFGHGEAVRPTIDELLDFRRRLLAHPNRFCCDVAFLRGTQEEMLQKLLQLQFAPNPNEVLAWMANAGIEPTLLAYGGDLRQGFAASRNGPQTLTRWTNGLRAAINAAPGHTMLLSALRHAAFTEEGGLLFVHAAVDPMRPLAAQGDAFWWGRKDVLELTAPFSGFRRVVRGIDRQHRGLVEREFAVSVDAGAGLGGRLLAACLTTDGDIVDCLEA